MENATNVTVNVNGQNMVIEGIARYTTCDDVIEMVFYNYPVNTDSYALFESSYGVERMLYGKESVLKVIRSWAADQNSFTLLVRKVDNVKSNMATLSQARRKLRKIRSLNANALSSEIDNRTIQANLNKSCDKPINLKDIDNISPAKEKDKHTKLGLLKRFLSDVMLQKKRQTNAQSRSRLGSRAPGDGCYGDEERNKRLSPVGIEEEKQFLRRHNSYLNAAFVEYDDSSDSNTNGAETDSIESDDESEFENESICEHERNICEMSESDSDADSSDNEAPFCDTADNTVIKCERIIDIFRKAEMSDNDSETEDDSMESFMKTIVDYCESDEGISSVESDSE